MIIIETGSGVANANSYGETDAPTTITNAKAYAADRGYPLLGDDDAAINAFLIKATDYIESRASEFAGIQVSPDQPLCFPRTGILKSDGNELASDPLPSHLIKALYQLCIEQLNGIVLLPSTNPADGGFVVREKIDVIETEYSQTLRTLSTPTMPAVEALLSSLLIEHSPLFLRAVRV
jgi:hypothetical protein